MTKGDHVTRCLVGGLFGNRCETNKQTNKQPDSVAFRSCEFRGTFRSQFWNAQILPE